jgi:hypothetical protein
MPVLFLSSLQMMRQTNSQAIHGFASVKVDSRWKLRASEFSDADGFFLCQIDDQDVATGSRQAILH